MILSYQSDYLSRTGATEIQAYVKRLDQLAGVTVRNWARLADLEEILQLVIDPSFMRQSGDDLNSLHINNYKIIKRLSKRQIDILSNHHPCLTYADFQEALGNVLGHFTRKGIINFPGLYPGSLGLLAVGWSLNGTDYATRFSKGAIVRINRYRIYEYSYDSELVGHILNTELSDLLISFPDLIYHIRTQAQTHNPARYIIPPTLSSIQFLQSWKMKALERLTLRDELTVPNPIEYLTSGTWVGYDAYTFVGTSSGLPPPMRAIKFKVTRERSSSVELKATNALDGAGRFSIFLEVAKRDGRFHGQKKHEWNIRWNWHGMVTPFGVFASWGTDLNGGHIWLWKDC